MQRWTEKKKIRDELDKQQIIIDNQPEEIMLIGHKPKFNNTEDLKCYLRKNLKLYPNFLRTHPDKIHFIQDIDFIRFINFAADVDVMTIGEIWNEVD